MDGVIYINHCIIADFIDDFLIFLINEIDMISF